MHNHLIKPLSGQQRVTNDPGTDRRRRSGRDVIITTFSPRAPLSRPDASPKRISVRPAEEDVAWCRVRLNKLPSAPSRCAGKPRFGDDPRPGTASRSRVNGRSQNPAVAPPLPQHLRLPPGEDRRPRTLREGRFPEHATPNPNTLTDRRHPGNPGKASLHTNVSKYVRVRTAADRRGA